MGVGIGEVAKILWLLRVGELGMYEDCDRISDFTSRFEANMTDPRNMITGTRRMRRINEC